MPSAWIAHCKAVYAAGKKKNSAYKYSQAMKDAKKTYKKGGKAAAAEPEEAPKKKRGRKKKKAQKDQGEEVAHTKGVGNVEEGRIAEKKPKAKRKRKRPVLGKNFRNVN
jgi:hypothetical protein